MDAAINFSDRVQLEVNGTLGAPVTKPHCHKCGMPNFLRADGDKWICKRCAAEAEAAKPQGPYYDADRGELCIPNTIDVPDVKLEWMARGFLYDPERRVWWIAIPENRSISQLVKAQNRFERVSKGGAA